MEKKLNKQNQIPSARSMRALKYTNDSIFFIYTYYYRLLNLCVVNQHHHHYRRRLHLLLMLLVLFFVVVVFVSDVWTCYISLSVLVLHCIFVTTARCIAIDVHSE